MSWGFSKNISLRGRAENKQSVRCRRWLFPITWNYWHYQGYSCLYNQKSIVRRKTNLQASWKTCGTHSVPRIFLTADLSLVALILLPSKIFTPLFLSDCSECCRNILIPSWLPIYISQIFVQNFSDLWGFTQLR